MAHRDYLFTSESVTEGHPDKIADQISDGVVDAIIEKDPYGRVAVETLVKTGLAIVAGEVTTNTYVDIPKIVRSTIAPIIDPMALPVPPRSEVPPMTTAAMELSV